jgi:uncharacterized membrane protein
MTRKLYILSILCILFVIPIFAFAQQDIFKAKVLDIVSSNETTLEGLNITTIEQKIRVLIIDGDLSQKEFTFTQNKFEVEEGEYIFMQQIEEGQFQLLEKDRTQMIFFVVLIFILLIFALNRMQGLRSILGLLLSFLVIIFVMLPLIISGFNPLLVSIVVGALILSSVLFLSHGYNQGSLIALCGTLGAILCAGLLSLGVSIWMKLTGLGSDESLNALIVTGGSIDFGELLLAGIIIGMLGVLDDIAITQVAVVSEIKKANPLLATREVFVRALRVGKEHVSALVNTLILAYTGASFPLLILLYKSGVRFDLLISQEIVSVEIVRTLVGSIGLIIAVPLTTYLAARFLKSNQTITSHCAHTHH